MFSLQPKEWDFTCFYMFGKVAKEHLDFYNPSDYYKVLSTTQLPFTIDQDFKVELLNVGCLYPPPTVFLFLPLGYMSYHTAMYFAYFFILLSVIACIFLLKQIFFTNEKVVGLLISSIILLSFPPLISTILFTQTCIFLLMLLLLLFYTRDKAYSGIFLALAIFIKPFAGILLLYFILRKQWNTLLFFFITCTVIGIISLAYFGVDIHLEYILSNPSKRLPSFWWLETSNQSLLCQLYRTFPNNWKLAQLINNIVSVVLVSYSAYLTYIILKRKVYDLIFPLLLVLALIIYPNGQLYYPIVHALSIFIIFKYIANDKLKLFVFVIFFVLLFGNMLFENIFLYGVISILLSKTFWTRYVEKQYAV
jgi:hypothetical protein